MPSFTSQLHYPGCKTATLSAPAVWLTAVILVAVIVLVVSGWAPAMAVSTVGGSGLLAAKLRRDLL